MATLGFTPTDFEIFAIAGFSARMEKIYERLRPKLTRLGNELAPELSRKLHLELFPHVAKHVRRTISPPPETWVAFGPSPRGYKRHCYLSLCVSRAGLHARAVVKAEAGSRPAMAVRLRSSGTQLAMDFAGTRIARYENWDCSRLPAPAPADADLFDGLAESLVKRSGWIDLGFGWTAREALRLDRGEMIDAFGELEPLYRLLVVESAR